MKITKVLTILVLGLGMMVLLPTVSKAAEMGTAFTYQGRLIDDSNEANGPYDFQFKLFDDATDGNQIGDDVTVLEMDVFDGYFTVLLDFNDPNVFNGDARWLEIGVRDYDPCDVNAFTGLSPRQELTPTPYALYAKNDGDWMVYGNDMYSIPSGNVGIGTTSPGAKLDVVDGTIRNIGNSGSATFTALRTGGAKMVFESWLSRGRIGTETNHRFDIFVNNGAPSLTVATSGRVGIGTTSPNGALDVNGPIYQRGGLLHADYVFQPEYQLETIDEHSELMWQNKHLSAIPKARVAKNGQQLVEVGAHRRGIVEELEKAHIYIEQLHRRTKALEERLEVLERAMQQHKFTVKY